MYCSACGAPKLCGTVWPLEMTHGGVLTSCKGGVHPQPAFPLAVRLQNSHSYATIKAACSFKVQVVGPGFEGLGSARRASPAKGFGPVGAFLSLDQECGGEGVA